MFLLLQGLVVPWHSILTSLPAWSIGITTFGRIWIHYTFIIPGPMYMKTVLGFSIQKVLKTERVINFQVVECKVSVPLNTKAHHWTWSWASGWEVATSQPYNLRAILIPTPFSSFIFQCVLFSQYSVCISCFLICYGPPTFYSLNNTRCLLESRSSLCDFIKCTLIASIFGQNILLTTVLPNTRRKTNFFRKLQYNKKCIIMISF